MLRRTILPLLLFTVILITLPLTTGCSPRRLIYDASVTPLSISPNADGQSDVARIEYKLSRTATLSIYLIDAEGNRHYFRDHRLRSRSVGRPYRVDFSGVIPREINGFRQDRVLPDGTYTLVIEATDKRGYTEQVTFPFTIHDADTTPPELQGFGLDRHLFTPNRDGVNDRVQIHYYLTKPANVLVYLLGPDGKKYPIEEAEGPVERGQPGPHNYDYEGGVDRGAEPPPDGTYTVVAYAEDQVGNKVTLTDTLTIADGGVPRATIVGLEWEVSSTVVAIGETLYFTLTVENYGDTPVRTTGPPPGTIYTTEQNYNSLHWYQSSGAWRVGIGFEGCAIGDYPWRWSLGRPEELTVQTVNGEDFYYLMPGQRAVITGGIKILSAPPRNPTPFWAGLIHEDVAVVNQRVDPKWITVDAPPDGPWGARDLPTPVSPTNP